MLKILFWSNEKWRDEAPNRLVRRLEPAGGHFIPSQMAAHDANSGSGPDSLRQGASQTAGAAPTLHYGPAGDSAPRLRLKQTLDGSGPIWNNSL